MPDLLNSGSNIQYIDHYIFFSKLCECVCVCGGGGKILWPGQLAPPPSIPGMKIPWPGQLAPPPPPGWRYPGLGSLAPASRKPDTTLFIKLFFFLLNKNPYNRSIAKLIFMYICIFYRLGRNREPDIVALEAFTYARPIEQWFEYSWYWPLSVLFFSKLCVCVGGGGGGVGGG